MELQEKLEILETADYLSEKRREYNQKFQELLKRIKGYLEAHPDLLREAISHRSSEISFWVTLKEVARKNLEFNELAGRVVGLQLLCDHIEELKSKSQVTQTE